MEPTAQKSRPRAPTLACLLLLAVTLGVYAQTWNHPFINFDDPKYVTENPFVKAGLSVKGLVWAFTTTAVSNWHPLTWLSHMADVEFFGLNPGGHHLTSVLVHVACAGLLFLFFSKTTGAPWRSLFVAALFALHPTHVESVAWIAERKDVLSALFFVLTLLAYAQYARSRSSARWYGTALALFATGLLAKPMLVTLPVVLLLLDYWPLGRLAPGSRARAEDEGSRPAALRLVLLEKLPFFLLSAVSSAITIYAQKAGGAMKSLEAVRFGVRLQNSLVAYARYFGLALYPHDLGIFYPLRRSVPLGPSLAAAAFLATVSVAVIVLRRHRPYLLVGWGWFLVTLVPVIGLIQVGGQSMADRYTYLPYLGLFVAAVWGVGDVTSRFASRAAVLSVAGAGLIIACTCATALQLRYWKDQVELYRHTLEVTSDNYIILNNYGIALAQKGRLEEAVGTYREALRVWPYSSFAELNLGAALADQGHLGEAIEHYGRALALNPGYAMAEMNLGRAYAKLGVTGEAIRHYEQALSFDPELADSHFNLGYLLVGQGELARGWQHYVAGLRLDPWSANAQNNMGVAFAQRGVFDQAVACFQEALRLDPAFSEAHFNFGVTLAKQQRRREAEGHFREVLRLRPDSAPARRWLSELAGSAP